MLTVAPSGASHPHVLARPLSFRTASTSGLWSGLSNAPPDVPAIMYRWLGYEALFAEAKNRSHSTKRSAQCHQFAMVSRSWTDMAYFTPGTSPWSYAPNPSILPPATACAPPVQAARRRKVRRVTRPVAMPVERINLQGLRPCIPKERDAPPARCLSIAAARFADCRLDRLELRALPPVGLPLLGEGRDRVVVRVPPGQRLGVLELDAGAVVLRPVRDPALAVVFVELVDPPLPDERDVAHHAWGGEPGEVAHDRVLELLGLRHAGPPVLAVGDHVAHVEVVG